MNITLLDGIVIAITVISALLAMFRGFVREVLSIAAWVIAAVAAFLFYDDLAPLAGEYIGNELIASAVSAALIFFLVLILVSFITMKVSDFVIDSRVGILDRTLGLVFGAARGILLVVVGMIFFNWLVAEANRPAWVVEAKSYPFLASLGNELLSILPEDPEATLRRTLDERMGNRPPLPEGAEDLEYEPTERQGLDQLFESTGEPDGSEPGADAEAPGASDPPAETPNEGQDGAN